MFDLFLAGGKLGMSILTAELICMLFAAWKAPAWVKEIGLLALVTGIFYQFLGMFQAFGVIQIFRCRHSGCLFKIPAKIAFVRKA